MPWHESRGKTDPKYRTKEYKRYRDGLVRQLSREGFLICVAPVCMFPSREITNPNGREPDGLTAGHEDDGVRMRGPEHNRCNVRDGARRARAMQTESMPLTVGIVRPGA